MRRAHLFAAFLFMTGALLFTGVRLRLDPVAPPKTPENMLVTLPVFVQVLFSGGDRYLAANIAAIRALIADNLRFTADGHRVLARVQDDASWLNPAHEDNYYIAAAILPWAGQYDAAQAVLRRAAVARPYDYKPAFYYAFNIFYFTGDGLAAADVLRRAAPGLPDAEERLLFEDLASRWAGRTLNLEAAANFVEAMARQAGRKDFAAYLYKRAQRLRDLAALRAAALRFQSQAGRPPTSLQELVSSGVIPRLPTDPFGIGYRLGLNGVPEFEVAR